MFGRSDKLHFAAYGNPTRWHAFERGGAVDDNAWAQGRKKCARLRGIAQVDAFASTRRDASVNTLFECGQHMMADEAGSAKHGDAPGRHVQRRTLLATPSFIMRPSG